MTDYVGEVLEGDCISVMASFEAESIHSICTDPPYGLSFDGHEWDSFGSDPKKFQEWSRLWAVQALRVLKPGGYLLSFSGTRTFHRMVCGIEDAGFEVKDAIAWQYMSGFPKGHDISKAIDDLLGVKRKVVGKKLAGIGTGKTYGFTAGNVAASKEIDVTAPESEDAKDWSGWNSALKPSFEPICVAQKPIEQSSIAKQVLVSGTGGMNIDASRIGDEKRWPSNTIFSHSECCGDECVPGCPVAEFERQGGNPAFYYVAKPSNEEKWLYCRVCEVVFGKDTKNSHMTHLLHCKTCKIEFDLGKDLHKNHDTDANVFGHPTQKPLSLFRNLVRLVTKKGGVVLDPFGGSCTTAVAAHEEGLRYVMIERDSVYAKVGRERIKWANSQLSLF